VQADPGLAFLAVDTTSAGDVERYRHQIADLDELDVPAYLHHLTGDLVAEREPGRCRRPATHHVLVAAADVGRHHLQNRAVRNLPADVRGVDPRSVLEFQGWVVDGLDRHRAW